MGVQATRYEKATRGHPDRPTAYYLLIKSEGEGTSEDKLDEAIECLREAGGVAWLDTNSLLFSHALEYQNKMIEFIMNSREAIQALHEPESSTGSPEKSQAPRDSSSGGSEWSHSTSPAVVLLGEGEEAPADAEEEEDGSDNEEMLLPGTVSLLDSSNLDKEETHKAAVCKKAHKSDVRYAAWWDEQICQGNDDIAMCDKRVYDHTNIGKYCKAPDKIGPLLTYIEERWVFKLVEAINNPLQVLSDELQEI